MLLTIASAPAFAHSYGPLPRLTGGPGDNAKVCTQCHTGTVLNGGTGSVNILLQSGTLYIPGVKQRVTVTVADQGQKRWGFELSARLNSDLQSGQAGQLLPVDNLTQVICEDAGTVPCLSGVSFIQHTSAGTRSGTLNGASFQFDWIPPSTNAGSVTFYVAGNAANGDGTSGGDHIYTSSIQLNSVTPVAPAVSQNGVVGAATLITGPVAPNSWITVYGTNLGATTRSWLDSDFVNGAYNSLVTLPQFTLAGNAASVASGTVLAGAGGVYQITIQIPAAASSGDLPLVAQLGTTSSASALITVQR